MRTEQEYRNLSEWAEELELRVKELEEELSQVKQSRDFASGELHKIIDRIPEIKAQAIEHFLAAEIPKLENWEGELLPHLLDQLKNKDSD